MLESGANHGSEEGMSGRDKRLEKIGGEPDTLRGVCPVREGAFRKPAAFTR
jgi:hypothetical protein